jgi:hypothetical protein
MSRSEFFLAVRGALCCRKAQLRQIWRNTKIMESSTKQPQPISSRYWVEQYASTRRAYRLALYEEVPC